jgi:hypothetical protein
MSKHIETLTFNSFSGYYGAVPDGYGGFDWTDIVYFNNTKSGGPEANDEGFHDAIRGRGEAGFGADSGGSFESANLSETFNLKSMLADSGTGSGVPIIFTSFTYSDGELKQKARDVLDVTPTVQRIDFATIGAKSDFQNIVAVYMSVGSAKYGHHYGHNAIGNGMVFDNLKLQWNGNIPGGELSVGSRQTMPHIPHVVATHLSALAENTCGGPNPEQAMAHSNYHSALTSLDFALGHFGTHADLTSLFALPEPDHFGT